MPAYSIRALHTCVLNYFYRVYAQTFVCKYTCCGAHDRFAPPSSIWCERAEFSFSSMKWKFIFSILLNLYARFYVHRRWQHYASLWAVTEHDFCYVSAVAACRTHSLQSNLTALTHTVAHSVIARTDEFQCSFNCCYSGFSSRVDSLHLRKL